MKNPPIQVSDHAVLRYLERKGGFNIDGLRKEIATRAEPAHQAGASSVIVDGIAFIIVNGVVTTALIKQTMICRQPKSGRGGRQK